MAAKDDKTAMATATAGCNADPAAPLPPQAPLSGSSQPGKIAVLLAQACGACARLAVLAFLACGFVQAARRARGDPWDLAFVFAAYAVLAALFLCLRRAERLTPASPAGERKRLQLAVWVLSSALSCAFAYRISRVMPAAVAVAVWSMTASVVAGGLYFLVLSDGR